MTNTNNKNITTYKSCSNQEQDFLCKLYLRIKKYFILSYSLKNQNNETI